MAAVTTKILFNKSTRGFVLDIFGKGIDSEGFIIERSSKTRVLTPEGREITSEELAVIKKGSEKFIAGDLTSLMKLTKNEL
jgi:hypothetical protein